MAAKKEFTPEVVKKLVMPLLKMEQHIAIYVKVTGKVFEGKQVNAPGKEGEKPADLCNCVNMATGEECQIIVPAVVKSVWEDDYPKDGYVGKGFAITKGEKAPGKRYFQYLVDEIKVPA